MKRRPGAIHVSTLPKTTVNPYAFLCDGARKPQLTGFVFKSLQAIIVDPRRVEFLIEEDGRIMGLAAIPVGAPGLSTPPTREEIVDRMEASNGVIINNFTTRPGLDELTCPVTSDAFAYICISHGAQVFVGQKVQFLLGSDVESATLLMEVPKYA